MPHLALRALAAVAVFGLEPANLAKRGRSRQRSSGRRRAASLCYLLRVTGVSGEEPAMRTRLLVCLSGAAAFSLGALHASAHHGWAGQEGEQFELSGKLHKDVSLAGAHATMQIVDAKGQVWDLTLAPAARTERAGLKEGVIPMGAEVTISGHRNSDMQRFEVKTERVTYNGKNYDVYPDRV
jgi:hypothetical protein